MCLKKMERGAWMIHKEDDFFFLIRLVPSSYSPLSVHVKLS